MKKEKLLLTGGLGFIGHSLALKLCKNNMEPIVFDNYSQNIQNDWHRNVVNERIELLKKCDIRIISGDTRNMEDLRSVLKDVKPDKIVHMSAIPSVVISNKNPGESFDHNLLSTKNILEVIRTEKLDIKQLLYFSSSTVYGDFKTTSVNENSPTEPKGIYEAAKLSSELIMKAYHNLIGLPYTVVRPSALYGERCINNRVSQIFIEQAIRGKELTVEDDGEERLDFTYIGDLVEGLFLMLTKEEALNQTFNITRGKGEKINKLIEILKDYFPDLKVKSIKRDKMKPKRGTLEISKAKDMLGYEPKIDLEQGYRNYIEWYLNSNFKECIK